MSCIGNKFQEVSWCQADRHGVIERMIVNDICLHHMLVEHSVDDAAFIINQCKRADRAGTDAQSLP